MNGNYSTKLYNTLTQPATMRNLLASYFNDNRNQAVALLQKSGVAISSTAPVKDVQIAWLKALKDSASFRDQAATELTGYVTTLKSKIPGQSNFVTQNGYYNDVTDFGISQIDPNSSTVVAGSSDTSSSDSSSDTVTPFAPLSPVGLASTGPSDMTSPGAISNNPNAVSGSMANPSSSSGSGGIFSALGSIFTPKVIQAGITTGLQAYSTGITAKANQTSEQNALQLEQAKLAQAQLAAQNPTGLSTGWMIVIGVGIGAVLIGVVVMIRKRGRK